MADSKQLVPVRLSLPDVVPEFAAYLQQPGNSAWGAVHIVLEDGNHSDSDVEYCIHSAQQRGDAEGERISRLLRSLSRTQRGRLDRDVRRYLKSAERT